jgi:hypothetical protein
MLNCFEHLDSGMLDRASCKCRHKLMGHPALEFANLARVIPELPPSQVMYSVRQLGTGENFEKTFQQRPLERSIEETLENMRTSDSYVMIQSPEKHPSFRDLHRQLLADVEELMRQRGVGKAALHPHLYLFLASPGSVTPFHLDRYSTFLLQFSGSKRVSVFPQWDEAVVTAPRLEAYVAYHDTSLPWSEEMNALGTHYEFGPGDALHIPFAAGHHVRNGAEEVSVSMSIIFNTRESVRWRNALNFNHAARRRLSRVGLSINPVGRSKLRDRVKAQAWSLYSTVRGK